MRTGLTRHGLKMLHKRNVVLGYTSVCTLMFLEKSGYYTKKYLKMCRKRCNTSKNWMFW